VGSRPPDIRLTSCPGGRGGDGGACLVDVQELSVQAAVLVQVAAGDLRSAPRP
jgi:hypothetical protein